MEYGLSNCIIYTGARTLRKHSVVVSGGRIGAVVAAESLPEDLQIIDLDGSILAPGFIDLQVNGGGGCMLNRDPTEECIRTIYEAHRRFGTTRMLPTLITSTRGKMLKAIDSARRVLEAGDTGVLGIHLEGPYISKDKPGIHDARLIRAPDEEELKTVLDRGRGAVKAVTVAPEVVEDSHVRMIREAGAVVSAGHTNATYERGKRFFEWGGTLVTHLFNAMSQFESREPGMVGAAYDSDAWVGIIVDGFHVDYASVRISKREKGARLILVTDAMATVGTASISFEIGGRKISCDQGRCMTEEGKLAGSALDMASAVRNCVQHVGIPLDEALRMASTYPAMALGIGDRYGRIEEGYRADMVVMDDSLEVAGAIRSGCMELFEDR